jgi:phosphate transport system permease protein
MALGDPDIIGKTVPVWVFTDDDIDMIVKGQFSRDVAEENRRVSDQQLAWLDRLRPRAGWRKNSTSPFSGRAIPANRNRRGSGARSWGPFSPWSSPWSSHFPSGWRRRLSRGVRPEEPLDGPDRGQHQQPGGGALDRLRPAGACRLSEFLRLPRSAPLVGGLVLTLMTLPTIIIASRSALKSVPPSIREAALGVGASKMQMVVHHVLPLAVPGMLTGTIIGMARALGESAPLLMIGMVAFIVDIPKGSPTRPPCCRSRSTSGRTARSGPLSSAPRPPSCAAGLSAGDECDGRDPAKKIRAALVACRANQIQTRRSHAANNTPLFSGPSIGDIRFELWQLKTAQHHKEEA